MTRVLVIGSGGREHAICRALAAGDDAPEIFVAPGNAGTQEHAKNVAVAAKDVSGLVDLARAYRVDLVFPGPEAPLVLGLADRLAAVGIACCGPKAAGARLEGSKRFTRELGAASGVPGPRFCVISKADDLAAALASFDGLPVVKADGLAQGKGVFLPEDQDGCVRAARDLLAGSLGEAGNTVVLEERLTGVEASLFFACHGTRAVALPHARDHKRLHDGDEGPNTGGMGAVSPNPALSDALSRKIRDTIVGPVLRALENAGTPFVGFLFAGVMLTADGPKLLEFNVRLGDPEAQAILPRLAPGELLRLATATARHKLVRFKLKLDPRPTCAVVLAAHGYPDSPRQGDTITVDARLASAERWLDHAGTGRQDGKLVTQGGRVAAVVARGESAESARRSAYAGVEMVHFAGKQFRTDIGGAW